MAWRVAQSARNGQKGGFRLESLEEQGRAEIKEMETNEAKRGCKARAVHNFTVREGGRRGGADGPTG
jgi:hypothetical protein